MPSCSAQVRPAHFPTRPPHPRGAAVAPAAPAAPVAPVDRSRLAGTALLFCAGLLFTARVLTATDIAIFPFGDGFDSLAPALDHQAFEVTLTYTLPGGCDSAEAQVNDFRHGWLRVGLPEYFAELQALDVTIRRRRTPQVPFDGDLHVHLTQADLLAIYRRERRAQCNRALAIDALLHRLETDLAERSADSAAPDAPDAPDAFDAEDSYPVDTSAETGEDALNDRLTFAWLAAPDLIAGNTPDTAAHLPADLILDGAVDADCWQADLRRRRAAEERPPAAAAACFLLPMVRIGRHTQVIQLQTPSGRPMPDIACQFYARDASPDDPCSSEGAITDSAGRLQVEIWDDATWQIWFNRPPDPTVDAAGRLCQWRLPPRETLGALPAGQVAEYTVYPLRSIPPILACLQLETPLGDPVGPGVAQECLQRLSVRIGLFDDADSFYYNLSGLQADGRFAIPFLPPGHYHFRMTSDRGIETLGFAGDSAFTVDTSGELVGAQPLTVRVRRAWTHEVRLRIFDADTDAPLPGAQIYVQLPNLCQEGATDAAGWTKPMTLPAQAGYVLVRMDSQNWTALQIILDHDGDYRLEYRPRRRLYLAFNPPPAADPDSATPAAEAEADTADTEVAATLGDPRLTLTAVTTAQAVEMSWRRTPSGAYWLELPPDGCESLNLQYTYGQTPHSLDFTVSLATHQTLAIAIPPDPPPAPDPPSTPAPVAAPAAAAADTDTPLTAAAP